LRLSAELAARAGSEGACRRSCLRLRAGRSAAGQTWMPAQRAPAELPLTLLNALLKIAR
jgi:hypothetical protein